MRDKFERLKAWIEENGGYIDPDITLDYSNPNNRSLKVTQDKDAHLAIIKIPRKCGLTVEKDNLFDISLKFLEELSKGKNSFYYPYLQILPTLEVFKKDLPIYIDNPSKKYLKKYQNIIEHEINIFYKNYLLDSDLPIEYRTTEMAKYAISTYHSRAWQHWGYIPMIDLCQHANHPNLRNSVGLDSNGTNYVFFTGLEFKKNSDLVWEYNTESNLHLYCNYGIDVLFPINYVAVDLYVREKQDPNFILKKNILNSVNININKFKIVFTDNGFNFNQLAALRIMTCENRSILENINIKDFYNNNKIINMNNETHFLKILIDTLIKRRQNDDLDDPLVIKNNKIIESSLNHLRKYWISFIIPRTTL